MKRNFILFSAVAVIALLSSCTQSEVLVDNNAADGVQRVINFGLAMPENSTRASYAAGATFQAGDAFAVYGFQDGNSKPLFNDESVAYDAENEKWSYASPRYWNEGSTYAFYAIFPYAVTHTFGSVNEPYFTVSDFVVADEKDDQTDVMIAQENTTAPFNTVDLVFNHILSNVGFTFRVSNKFAMTGIGSVTVNSFDVTGLYSTGTYTQTGFDNNSATVGAWADQSGTYDFPVVEEGEVTGNSADDYYTLADDLLLLPQTISEDATLSISYTLNYEDGDCQSTFTKEVSLASIKDANKKAITEWLPNVRYNYTLAVNPAFISVVLEGVDWDGSDGGGDEVESDGVVYNDENGNWWLDVDADGDGEIETYPVVWEDIDGDGKLEGGVDRDGDGQIDNVDKENTISDPDLATGDKETEPSDGTTLEDHEGKDVIMYLNDDEWMQLQFEDVNGETSAIIEFSATVEDWKSTKDVYVVVPNN